MPSFEPTQVRNRVFTAWQNNYVSVDNFVRGVDIVQRYGINIGKRQEISKICDVAQRYNRYIDSGRGKSRLLFVIGL